MGSLRIVKILDPTVIAIGAIVYKGAYDNSTDYAPNDSVSYLGSSYVMYADASAGTLPTDTTKWQILAGGLGLVAGVDYAVGSVGLAGGQTIAGSTLTTENLTLRANAADLTTGQINITSTKEATNTTTAALAVAGGLAVAKRLYALNATVTNAITGSVTGNAGTVTNATLTTALTVNTGTVTLTGNVANTSVLTIGAGAVSVSGANTGDQTLPVKASGAELDTGTDDAKFATAKALKDSHNVPSVAPGTSGNVLTSDGTDWTSAANTGGVTSITGTANQVIADTPTGAVTLSLPQSIATSSSPTFANLTIATLLTAPTVQGSVASGGNLTLKSTAHATKGKIIRGTSAYDEVNNREGIGIATPLYTSDILSTENKAMRVRGVNGGGVILGAYNTTYGGMWASNTTPTNGNYIILSDGSNVAVNTPTGGVIQLGVNDAATYFKLSGTTGYISIGGSFTAAAQLHTQSSAAGTIGEIVQGAASQSADLSQWRNSAGTVLARVDAAGKVGIGTTTPAEALSLASGNFLLTQGTNPTLKGVLVDATNLNGAYAVKVSGNYAYVTSYEGDRLTIVDISNPALPVLAGSLHDATNLAAPQAVVVAGKYAYVTSSTGHRLNVIDISNPFAPTLTGSLLDATNLSQPIGGFEVVGKYAYITDFATHRLTIVDVSNPAAPVVVGNVVDATNLASPWGVKVVGKYAYVAAYGFKGLTIVDVSDVTTPVVVGTAQDNTSLNGPTNVYVVGRYAYITVYNGNRLTVVDVLDPTTPVIVGSLNDNTNLSVPFGLSVAGRYAYVVASSGKRLTVVNISDPTAPVVASSLNDATNLNDAEQVAVSGKYAFVTAYTNDSLTVIDVSGIDVPTANIGNLASNDISVSNNLDVISNLYVHQSISVGPGGILSDGPISASNIKLAAGTATAGTAPIKFTSGTNLATAEAGAMEYNGTNLFFTRAGTTRENVMVAIDNASAPSTNAGTPTTRYGGDTKYLGDPNRWLSVNILGSTYKIPLFT